MSQLDSVVRSVIQSFVERAQKGKEKYGTDLDRQDVSVLEWIQHAQEEHMDAILYLEKLKQVHLPQPQTQFTQQDSISKDVGCQ